MCAAAPASRIDTSSAFCLVLLEALPGLTHALPLPNIQSDGRPRLPICLEQLADEKVIMLIHACLSELFPFGPYAMTYYISAAPGTW